jgi:hypothetical protein
MMTIHSGLPALIGPAVLTAGPRFSNDKTSSPVMNRRPIKAAFASARRAMKHGGRRKRAPRHFAAPAGGEAVGKLSRRAPLYAGFDELAQLASVRRLQRQMRVGCREHR